MRNLRLTLILILLLAGSVFGQRSQPRLEGYLSPQGKFLSVPEMWANMDSISLIAKYLPVYASAPDCARPGQMYFDSGLGKMRVCTVAGSPGTWETSASGSAVGDVIGPASAVDNAISRNDGTTGKRIQSSLVTLGDFGEIALSTANQARTTSGEYLNIQPHVTLGAAGLYMQGAWIDPFITGSQNAALLQAGRIDSTVQSGYTGTLTTQRALQLNPLVDFGNAVVGTQTSLLSAPDFEGLTLTTMRGFHHAAFFYHPGGTFTTHEGIRLDNPDVAGGTLLNNYGIYIAAHTAGSTLNYNIYSAGAGSTNEFQGKVNVTGALVIPSDSLTDNGTTIATNASLGNNFRVTALTANVTLSNPTNSADGQRVVWEVIQNAGAAKTLAFGTNFGFGTEITACTVSTTLSSHNFITATYNSTTTKWYVTGCLTGY